MNPCKIRRADQRRMHRRPPFLSGHSLLYGCNAVSQCLMLFVDLQNADRELLRPFHAPCSRFSGVHQSYARNVPSRSSVFAACRLSQPVFFPPKPTSTRHDRRLADGRGFQRSPWRYAERHRRAHATAPGADAVRKDSPKTETVLKIGTQRSAVEPCKAGPGPALDACGVRCSHVRRWCLPGRPRRVACMRARPDTREFLF